MNKILLAAGSYILGRSRTLRRLLPFVPIALAIGQYLADRRRTQQRLKTPTYGGERPGAYTRAPAAAASPSVR